MSSRIVIDEIIDSFCTHRDDRSFEIIAHCVRVWVYRHIMSEVRDPALADDLIQEVLIRICSNIHTHDRESNFGSWVFRIASNVVADWARRTKRERYCVVYGVQLEKLPVYDPDDIEQQIILDQQAQKIHRCVKKLSPKRRQVLGGMYFEDKSVKHLALELGVTEGAIRSTNFHAKKDFSWYWGISQK